MPPVSKTPATLLQPVHPNNQPKGHKSNAMIAAANEAIAAGVGFFTQRQTYNLHPSPFGCNLRLPFHAIYGYVRQWYG